MRSIALTDGAAVSAATFAALDGCAPTDGWAIHFSSITWGRPTFALVKGSTSDHHIGLSTVTYLFDGEIHHRDSLGVSQKIRPGEVNWMTAGSGIVHSERTDPSLRSSGGLMHGMQAWVALPHEDDRGWTRPGGARGPHPRRGRGSRG